MAIIIGSTSAGAPWVITLADIKAAIQAHGYDTDTAAQQTIMIQMILRRLHGMRRWQFLVEETTAYSATLANTGRATLTPLGRGLKFDSVRMSLGTETWDLEPVDHESMIDKRHDDVAVGRPKYWARERDDILVWPLPDQTYPMEIVWYGLTTIPQADGDAIAWPETHLDVLVYAALMRLTWRQRDWNGYDRAKADFTDALLEAMRDEGVTQRQVADHVQSWDGWAKMGI